MVGLDSARDSSGVTYSLALPASTIHVLSGTTEVRSGRWSLRLSGNPGGFAAWHSLDGIRGRWELRVAGVEDLEVSIYSDGHDSEIVIEEFLVREATKGDSLLAWGLYPSAAEQGTETLDLGPWMEVSADRPRRALILELADFVYRNSQVGSAGFGFHRLGRSGPDRAVLSPARPIVGTCDTFAVSLENFLTSLGVPARKVTVGTAEWLDAGTHRLHAGDVHVLVEAFDGDSGSWILVDPTFAAHFVDGSGQPIGLEQLWRLSSDGGAWRIEASASAKAPRRVEDYYLPYRSLFAYVFAPAADGIAEFNPRGVTPTEVIRRAAEQVP